MESLVSLSAFKNKVVYFDTNLFIYAVEQQADDVPFFAVLNALFTMASEGGCQAITSELSLAETLVGAYKKNNELVVIYDELFSNRPDLAVYPVDKAVLKSAAYIRTIVKVALADAIHVATALTEHADYFITNDDRLNTPEGIQKVLISDIVFD